MARPVLRQTCGWDEDPKEHPQSFWTEGWGVRLGGGGLRGQSHSLVLLPSQVGFRLRYPQGGLTVSIVPWSSKFFFCSKRSRCLFKCYSDPTWLSSRWSWRKSKRSQLIWQIKRVSTDRGHYLTLDLELELAIGEFLPSKPHLIPKIGPKHFLSFFSTGLWMKCLAL